MGVSAYDEFSRLVQTKRTIKNTRDAVQEVYLHNQCQSECHGYKKVHCRDFTRLEDVMAIMRRGKHLSTSARRERDDDDLQDGHVTEEDTYEQCT